MIRIPRFVLAAAWVLATDGSAPAATVPITTCGQTVAAGDTGVLQNDLACLTDPFAVRVLNGGTLDLAGHTISGGEDTIATVLGVRRADGTIPYRRFDRLALGSGRGNLTIRGPGTISGVNPAPGNSLVPVCVMPNSGKLHFDGSAGRIELSGCTAGVRGSLGAIGNRGRITAEHVDLRDSSTGLAAQDIVAHDVYATQIGGIALSALRSLELQDVVLFDNNGNGAYGRTIRGSNIAVTDTGHNSIVSRGLIDLANVTVVGGGVGVQALRVRLRDSSVTGGSSFDVVSRIRPVLSNVTCNRSSNFDLVPWGVCALD